VVVSPYFYEEIIEELGVNQGALAISTRARLSTQAFGSTAGYDRTIFGYLASMLRDSVAGGAPAGAESCDSDQSIIESFTIERFDKLLGVELKLETEGSFPGNISLLCEKKSELRYGENPHQRAALYNPGEDGGVANVEQLGGKEMSFNNYVDADAAWQLVCDFEELACAIIKHTNPAGVGLGKSTEEAYRRALATDPTSAFGGIVAFNRPVDEATARAVVEIFTEVVVAPAYDLEALEILRSKKNLRVLRATGPEFAAGLEYKQISGGMLLQTRDSHKLKTQELKVVSQRHPDEEELRALLFAWTVCKHTKSNAIVYAREGQTVGVGAGQMSRVDSVKIGAMRAQLPLQGSVLASDAFFPFRDGLDEAAKHGITAVIQPGGSMRDAEVIEAANAHGLAMVFTGIRHFKH